jgi:hypothetical protein
MAFWVMRRVLRPTSYTLVLVSSSYTVNRVGPSTRSWNTPFHISRVAFDSMMMLVPSQSGHKAR